MTTTGKIRSLIYFSGSGNTMFACEKYFAGQPLDRYEGGEFILAFPSYGTPATGGYVPPQVSKFLAQHSENLIGVVGFGNTTFGQDFCKGAKQVAQTYRAPLIACVDIVPTRSQIDQIKTLLEEK